MSDTPLHEAEIVDFKAPKKAASGVAHVTTEGAENIVRLSDRAAIAKGHVPEGRVTETLDAYQAANKGTAPRSELLETMKGRAKKPPSTIRTAETIREPMLSARNVGTGLTCLIAGMTGFSAFRNVSQGMQRDENGAMDVQKLGVGAVETLLTVGLAYLAYETHKPQQLSQLLTR